MSKDKYENKYHSTNQFRNVVKEFREGNYGKSIIDYIGTVKIHGTNASVVMYKDGTITAHSKNNLLGYSTPEQEGANSYTEITDNSGFGKFVAGNLDRIRSLFRGISFDVYPIKISGEWAGQGINKGVAVNELPKNFYIFGVKVGEVWIHINLIKNVHDNEYGIYNVMQFEHQKITIDFNNPQASQNTLVEYTNSVEVECPVGKYFGVTENKVGEGLVWTPINVKNSTRLWFKTKGQKHSVSKVRKLASVNPEKVNSINEFIDYAVTDNRLNQGVEEVGLDINLTHS